MSTNLNTSLLIPSAPPISFFWGVSGNETMMIPQCSAFPIAVYVNPGATVPPISPFYFLAAPVNATPDTSLILGNVGTHFNWTADFPINTEFVLAMSDSANSSGGSVGPYTIVPGTTDCMLESNDTSVSVVYDPPSNPCDEIDVTITGGIAPYTVSILSPKLGKYSNLTTTNNPIRLSNTINAGASFYIFVTDSTGDASVVSNSITSGLGQSTCSKPSSQIPKPSAPTRSLAAIVGGAVAGVLGSIILLAVIYFYYRRKKAAEAYERHQQEVLNTNSDFLMQDGYAPKVTPFVLPSAAAGSPQRFNNSSNLGSPAGNGDSNHAYAGLPPIQSNNLYTSSADNYSPTSPKSGSGLQSAYTTTTSPHSNSQYLYSPTPSTHPLLPHPPNPNPNPNPHHQQSNSNLNSTYHSTNGSTVAGSSTGISPYQNYSNVALPTLPVNSRTGLANPDDFEYRDSRNGY